MNRPKIDPTVLLRELYQDQYFPKAQVDGVRHILEQLMKQLDEGRASTLEELYPLTHAAVEKINQLAQEFEERGSEIETVARESIAEAFSVIAEEYGFVDADLEEMISNREW